MQPLSFVISKPMRKHIDTTELKGSVHLHRYCMNVIYDLLYISAFLSCPKGSEIQERFVPTWQKKPWLQNAQKLLIRGGSGVGGRPFQGG